MKLSKASALIGSPALPGDKSISHRAAMIAAIAEGDTRIQNFSSSADCSSTINCLRELGVQINASGSEIHVKGTGVSGLRSPAVPLDCGNSGTTMRLLAGVLAGYKLQATLTGDASLQKRPMERIAVPLRLMGTDVASTDGHAPLHIRGRDPLLPIDFNLPVASAQIKSAVLLAALKAKGSTTVVEPAPTRDHTERMLRWFGVPVNTDLAQVTCISIAGPSLPVSPGYVRAPGDISAASFFMVGAACLPGSAITIEGLGINPTRSALIDVLQKLGVSLEITNIVEDCNEPTATIRVRGGLTKPTDGKPVRVDGASIPNLIDELPILAVLGTQLPGGLEVRDASELRHKESDRISSIVTNLRLMGAGIDEFPDGFRIENSRLKGARLNAFDDHRIAMAFAVAGLLADGETVIDGAECTDISFPGFFETLQSIVR